MKWKVHIKCFCQVWKYERCLQVQKYESCLEEKHMCG